MGEKNSYSSHSRNCVQNGDKPSPSLSQNIWADPEVSTAGKMATVLELTSEETEVKGQPTVGILLPVEPPRSSGWKQQWKPEC